MSSHNAVEATVTLSRCLVSLDSKLVSDLHHPGNCWLEMELMEVDGTNESTETMPKINGNGNGIYLPPVSPESYGDGLPYAPINWPKPGDNWRWKVGRRVAITGHFLDRYLYLPNTLRRLDNAISKRSAFASKSSLEKYIKTAFPNADIDAFFASFSWKIPAKQLPVNGEEQSDSDGVVCKAGNKKCNSLVMQAEYSSLTTMPCDICCIEPQFCSDCCCILCNKFISLNYGGYSYIKCEAQVGEGYICGHVAHLNCALRCFMAGTIGGSIGLDAEYCCRRCDAKTDLILHATRLVRTCESVDCKDDIEKILNVGVCILRDSKKTSAKELLSRIELAIKKLKHGTSLRDIWKVEDSDVAISTGVSHDRIAALEVINDQDSPDAITSSQPFLATYSDSKSESRKLEEKIDRVLQALKNSQEFEYRLAEERLYAQKNDLCHLFQQLDKERADLAQHSSEAEPCLLLETIQSREDQIKRGVMKLKDMAEIAMGFGRTSKTILKDHFDLDVED
ncbi:hypothetical protein Q3G72_022466 [Acer saccharum]|nr:hypothetical protein Q3G72_022466 [Acer saccharum]